MPDPDPDSNPALGPMLNADAQETSTQSSSRAGRSEQRARSARGKRDSIAASGSIVNSSAGRDQHIGDTTNNTSNSGGIWVFLLAVAAIVAVVWIVVSLVQGASGAKESGNRLTTSSTCKDFLLADDATRGEAVRRIGVELEMRDAGSPMFPLNVEYNCGQAPRTELGSMISRSGQ